MGSKVRVTLRSDAYKKALRKRELTSQRIADRLNIDPTLLSHYVNGRRECSFATAERIADWLNIDIHDLIEPDSTICFECGQKVAA